MTDFSLVQSKLIARTAFFVTVKKYVIHIDVWYFKGKKIIVRVKNVIVHSKRDAWEYVNNVFAKTEELKKLSNLYISNTKKTFES